MLRFAFLLHIQARDDYYSCLDSKGVELVANDPVPEVCAKQREDFEASCKASWVKHFDATRDRELGVLRTLKSNINASEKTSVGTLSGKDQRG